ncbi:hypothetical protein K439DRAFT_1614958 [Ramaria rubella]|nr:hypothetical protein K439DRAFT_1614958 [Ramaria rubella]
MEGTTTLLRNTTHFSMASKDFLPQRYTHTPAQPTRKRKPVVTYQSPGSGVVDVGLLVRNTALELEAAAVAAASRSISVSAPVPATITTSSPPAKLPTSAAISNVKATVTKHATRIIPVAYRPVMIPRPPRPLYHPLSRPGTSKSALKSSTSTTSINSQLAPPSMEPGRRSSSRTRRPAPKVRDTESLVTIAKVPQEKPSPAKRRRGAGAGKRKRGVTALEADGDGAYPAAKRSRKPKERVEMELDGDAMPPPSTNETSPMGYSTRAKRPRGAAPARADSSTSDGTGSVARTTPVNGHVEEFWVPTKVT